MIDFRKVIQDTINNGGCTVNVRGKAPEKGYMVSMQGYEEKVPSCLPLSEIEEKIKLYRYTKSTLDTSQMSYLGTWIKEGYLYLDVSINVQDLGNALQFGYDNHQQEIYDIANDCYIVAFPLIEGDDLMVQTEFHKWLEGNYQDSFVESIKAYTLSEEPFKNRDDMEAHKYVYQNFVSMRYN